MSTAYGCTRWLINFKLLLGSYQVLVIVGLASASQRPRVGHRSWHLLSLLAVRPIQCFSGAQRWTGIGTRNLNTKHILLEKIHLMVGILNGFQKPGKKFRFWMLKLLETSHLTLKNLGFEWYSKWSPYLIYHTQTRLFKHKDWW